MKTDNHTVRSDAGSFRVAILGAGGIAPEHVIVLRRLPNVQVVASCDLNAERARTLAEAHGIPGVFVSPAEMLEKARPDVVHVLLPPAMHVRLAAECLKAGAHVLVEKPIGISTAECAELGRVAEAAGRAVGVNHNMVYQPVVQRLIGEVRSRRFGRITHVNLGWGMPTGPVRASADSRFFLQAPQNVLLEWAVHPLSVLRRLLGNLKRANTLVTGLRHTANGRPYYSSWQSSLLCERGTAQFKLAVGDGFSGVWMDVLGEDALAHVNLTHDYMILKEYSADRPAVAGFRDGWADSRRLFAAARRSAADYLLSGLGKPVPGAPGQRAMRDSIAAFYTALARGVPPPEGLAQGTAVIEYCEGIFAGAAIEGARGVN
jgi:predicted dehydrogenase